MSPKLSPKIIQFIIILLLIGASFFVGTYFGFENRPEVSKVTGIFNQEIEVTDSADFDPFWKAWNQINEKYVGATTTTSQQKVWGAIEGLAKSLEDPYTVFLKPEDLEIFEGDIGGSFSGVGMEIGIRSSILTVIAPLKGTPADEAGLLPGDKIIQINETVTVDMTIDKAVRLIRGERGSEVKLTIVRDGVGEPLEFKIVRAVINIPTIETEISRGSNLSSGQDPSNVRDDVYIIKLFNFSAVSPDQFRNALRDFIASGKNKLILDLRGNPGGFLEASVDIASWFLPVGKVIVKEDFGSSSSPRIHRSKGYDIFTEQLKFAILINRGSASASEILAGALSEHGKAILVGENTFGKGSVQELVNITKDSSLKITVAQWLTPDGNSISDGGLKPDYEVKITPKDIEAGRDPQLDKAIELLNNQ